MIVSLRGVVSSFGEDYVVLDVNGVGYQVFTPGPQHHALNVELFLHTVMVVRDDGSTLYGFSDNAWCELFRNLMKVSGIGPRLALSILSTMSPENLRQAVLGERPELIRRVPGVGRKTAEKIVVELRDKLGDGLATLPSTSLSASDVEVMDALTALGYSLAEAQAAMQALPPDSPDDVEVRLRLALQFFT
ncbi:MAG: Holliday junction branch migration protein RuvA [Anaerolineaceae bacterium]|nr:Holliday junction branch migration protein RuvA [Anaerolineaceae bacterium]